MVTITGVDFEGEDELILFTCFAVATTPNRIGRGRLYDYDECKGVAGLLMQDKKPDFLRSTEFKKMQIGPTRNKWRKSEDSEVKTLRAIVDNEKDKYLVKVSELFQRYQKSLDEKIPRSDGAEYGQLQVPGYTVSTAYGHPQTQMYRSAFKVPGYTVSTPQGHPQTHMHRSTFQTQRDASSDLNLQRDASPDPNPAREKLNDSLRQRLDEGYGVYGHYQVPGYTVSTARGHPQTHGYTSTSGTTVDDAVSTTMGALNLNATSLPPGPGFQYQSGTNQTQSQAEPEENSIVRIGASEYIASRDYTKGKAKHKCGSMLRHHDERYYGARGRVRNCSQHAIENYEAWKSQQRKEAEGDEDSDEPPLSPPGGSNPPPQRGRLGDTGGRRHHHAGTGKEKSTREHEDAGENPQSIPEIGGDRFRSSMNYLGDEATNPCTSRGFPPSHINDNYGAPGSRRTLGGPPSPHAVENYQAWEAQRHKTLNREAAGEEASSSSGKSKSPGYHEEKRERKAQHERKDPSGKRQGSQSKSSSKAKKSKSEAKKPDENRESQSKSSRKPKVSKSNDEKTDESRGSQSGGGSKQKDKGSEDNNQGGGRRRKARE
ncbi:hypothetical protein BDR22DRAFT_885496 [Usnea florida]